jgi:hypothetical protein
MPFFRFGMKCLDVLDKIIFCKLKAFRTSSAFYSTPTGQAFRFYNYSPAAACNELSEDKTKNREIIFNGIWFWGHCC